MKGQLFLGMFMRKIIQSASVTGGIICMQAAEKDCEGNFVYFFGRFGILFRHVHIEKSTL